MLSVMSFLDAGVTTGLAVGMRKVVFCSDTKSPVTCICMGVVVDCRLGAAVFPSVRVAIVTDVKNQGTPAKVAPLPTVDVE